MRSVPVIVSLCVVPTLAACVPMRPRNVVYDRSWCTRPAPCRTVAGPVTKAPPPARVQALYDEAGRPADLRKAAAAWGDVDLVAFGELDQLMCLRCRQR